ncbi:hypothetical protein V8F20_009372 [Naviculisporaceae sp. PSN 640]
MSTFEFRGVQRVASTYYRPVTRLDQTPEEEDQYQRGQNGFGSVRKPSVRGYPLRMSRAEGRYSAPRQPTPNYRPAPLRKTFLVVLIVVILGVIAAVGAGYRLLPPEVDRTLVPGSEVNSPARAKDDTDVPRAHGKLVRRALGPMNVNGSSNVDSTNRADVVTPISPLTSSKPPSPTPEASPAPSPVTKNVPAQTTGPVEIPSSALESLATSNPATSLSIESGAAFSDDIPFTRSFKIPDDPDNWATEGEWTITTPLPPPTTTSNMGDPFIGDQSDFANEGTWTETVTLPNFKETGAPGPPRGHHANPPSDPAGDSTGSGTETGNQNSDESVNQTPAEGGEDRVPAEQQPTPKETTTITTVSMETISEVVRPVTVLTTLNNVVSEVTRTTSSNGALTTIVESTTLNGIVSSHVEQITSAVVKTYTQVQTVEVNLVVSTFTNSHGVATATSTVTSYSTPTISPEPQIITKVYSISKGQYFVGFFLPPLLSGLISIPIRMIDLSAKQLQPWHELTQADGASAPHSLCLKFDGLWGIWTGMRALGRGQPLTFLTTILTICSLLLVPLSSEAISPKLHGACSVRDFKGCAMTLGVFLGPARGMIAVLVLMVVLLIAILLILRRWQSGVPTNPWSLAAVASLSTNKDIRALFNALPTGRKGERVERSEIIRALDGKIFKLGYFINQHGVPEYGITIVDTRQGRPYLMKSVTSLSLSSDSDGGSGRPKPNNEKHHLPFLMLSFTSRITFLLLITGVMAVTLYYNNTGGDTPFERFMGTQNLGVRAMFTLVGVAITLFWCSFFTGLSLLGPFRQLSHGPQPADRTILAAPSMTAFTGIYAAFQQRDWFLVLVAFTAILSEFMPLLLNNVPFKVTQTWLAHLVCTWMAITILSIMWIVVVLSFFIKWPHMPADPSTIAGTMFYVFDSRMLWSMEGMSVLDKEDRDQRVGELRMKFQFGTMMGLSGRKRTGVDAVHDQTI